MESENCLFFGVFFFFLIKNSTEKVILLGEGVVSHIIIRIICLTLEEGLLITVDLYAVLMCISQRMDRVQTFGLGKTEVD